MPDQFQVGGVPMTEALCKGAWLLGSACGRCSRCIEDAPKAAMVLMKENLELKRTRDEAEAAVRVQGYRAGCEDVVKQLRALSINVTVNHSP